MTQMTIIIIGNPTWADDLKQGLGAEYRVLHQTAPDGYMNTLIDSLAALVLVDGSQADWSQWVSPVKSSAATRRIPLIVVSDDASIRAEVTNHGGDAVLTVADVLKLPQTISNYIRTLTPEQQEQLDCDCQEALPPLAQAGVRYFNAGEYYKQHDSFEEQWVNTTSPVRDLYRAVLQVGVAYYQIERGNYRGALKMLQRSVQWLLLLPDICQGINVQKLRDDSFKVRAELERLGADRLDEFDKSLLRGVEYQSRK